MIKSNVLTVVRDRWLLIASLAVVGGLLGVLLGLLQPKTYTATVSFYVSAQSSDTNAQANQGAQLSQSRVISYVALLEGQRIRDEVARANGVGTDPRQLEGAIAASSATDSVLINSNTTANSPEAALQIARALAQTFPRIVAELERPVTPNTAPPVAVRVVSPPDLPTSSNALPLALLVIAGVLVGTVFGILAASARDKLDNSVRSSESLSNVTNKSLLGSVTSSKPEDINFSRSGDQLGRPFAEAMRQIRTNLQYVDVDRPPRTVLITSSLASEGKTTTVAGLARAFGAAGSRVLAIEADMRKPNLARLYGVDGTVGLSSVLSGRVRASDAIQTVASSAIDIMPSGQLPPNPSELLGSERMSRLLEELKGHYDIVLIDSPPVIPVTDAAALGARCDGAIFVCRYGTTSQAQVKAAQEALEATSSRVLGAIFTMLPASSRRNGYYDSYTYGTAKVAREPDGSDRTSQLSQQVLETAGKPRRRHRGD